MINHEIYELNTKTSTSQILAQKSKKKDNHTTKEIVPEEYYEYLLLFDEKKSECFLPARTWDHKMKQNQYLNPKLPNLTNYCLQKSRSRRNLLKKTYEKNILNPQNHQWYHLSFLLQRKMENYDYTKIIVISTNTLSKIPIQSPMFS